MKKLLILPLCLLLASCAHQASIKSVPIADKPACLEEPTKTLRVGEKLNYTLQWLGLSSGNITCEIKELAKIDNRSVYHIMATANPTGFLKLFYNTEYVVSTYVDARELKPVRFTKTRRSNDKLSEEEIEFSQEGFSADWKSPGSKNKKRIAVSGDVQDLLSAIYSFRVKDIVAGKNYPIGILYNGKVWKVDASLEDINNVVINNVGSFEAVKVKFKTDLNMRITGFNDAEIYLTVDSRRLPVLFRIRTKLGYVYGLLSSYQ